MSLIRCSKLGLNVVLAGAVIALGWAEDARAVSDDGATVQGGEWEAWSKSSAVVRQAELAKALFGEHPGPSMAILSVEGTLAQGVTTWWSAQGSREAQCSGQLVPVLLRMAASSEDGPSAAPEGIGAPRQSRAWSLPQLGTSRDGCGLAGSSTPVAEVHEALLLIESSTGIHLAQAVVSRSGERRGGVVSMQKAAILVLDLVSAEAWTFQDSERPSGDGFGLAGDGAPEGDDGPWLRFETSWGPVRVDADALLFDFNGRAWTGMGQKSIWAQLRCAAIALRFSFLLTGCIACTTLCVVPEPTSIVTCPCAYLACCAAFDSFQELIADCSEFQQSDGWRLFVELVETFCIFN